MTLVSKWQPSRCIRFVDLQTICLYVSACAPFRGRCQPYCFTKGNGIGGAWHLVSIVLTKHLQLRKKKKKKKKIERVPCCTLR
jgi:hypothetical protein